MEIQQHEQILELVDDLIDAMSEYENELYVVIEVAHQLRDELLQVEIEAPADSE